MTTFLESFMRHLATTGAIVLLSAACGGGGSGAPTPGGCATGMTKNPVTGECERDSNDLGPGGGDAGTGADAPGSSPDAANEPDRGTGERDGSQGEADMPPVEREMGGGDPDWPPLIESLYQPGMCFVPACDDQGDAGFDPSGDWVQTLTTTDSDCATFIMDQDARANPGNVDQSDPGPLDVYVGQCGSDDGEHVATAKNGIVARCDRNEQQFGVVSYETAVIAFSGDSGIGEAYVYLENVPSFVGEDCYMKFDVTYQRQ